MANETQPQTDARWLYGVVALLSGLVVLLLALLIVVQKFETAADVGAVLGVVASPIGTMVAAYFGVAIGSSGKDKSDAAAQQANATLLRAATARTPDELRSIIARSADPQASSGTPNSP